MDIINTHSSLCVDVAQNQTIPDDILFLLAKNQSATVRSLVAEKGRLPSTLFHVLANDDDERVRRSIAANRKTPLDILKGLSIDKIESVASVALFNLNARSR